MVELGQVGPPPLQHLAAHGCLGALVLIEPTRRQ
jgi:hypothetical protein